jgi:SAM-dependent methyltransferase
VNHCKLCNVEDFAEPGLRGLIRDIYPEELARTGAEFPSGREYRKHWEVAMAARALGELGALHEDAELLGVGAGTEATSFWLTRFVRRVFATDLYLQPGDWTRDAVAGMLAEPGQFAKGPWNPRRLVVQHMNGLDLAYDDDSFEGIYSSSSIEHFGEMPDIRRAVGEMFRVLKPGGVLTVSTEYRLAGPPPGLPTIVMFDEAELRGLFDGFDWEFVSTPDFTLSGRTRDSAVPFAEAAEDVIAGRSDWSRYPHIVLSEGEHVWTSVHVALRKRGSR